MTDKNRQLNGVFHGAKTILMNEGPMAFYKGFSMCWARVRLLVISDVPRILMLRAARDTYSRQLPHFRGAAKAGGDRAGVVVYCCLGYLSCGAYQDTESRSCVHAE